MTDLTRDQFSNDHSYWLATGNVTEPSPAELAAWQAVWDSGLLTKNVYTNSRIWKAVTVAIEAYEREETS